MLSDIVWLILAGGLATYAIRWAGYSILVRFKRLDPRVEIGMNAVPAAVLTAIVAPAAADGSPAEIGALAAAAALSFAGGSGSLAFIGGSLVLVLLRYLLG